MIFRIVNGEKKLFAEVNKLETINFLEAGEKKNLFLDANDIPYNKEDIIEEEFDTVKDKLDALETADGLFIKKANIQTGRAGKVVVTAVEPSFEEEGVITINHHTSNVETGLTAHDRFNIVAGKYIGFEGVADGEVPAVKINAEIGDVIARIDNAHEKADAITTEYNTTIPALNTTVINIIQETIPEIQGEITTTNTKLEEVNKTLWGNIKDSPEGTGLGGIGGTTGIETSDAWETESNWFKGTFMDVRKRVGNLEGSVVKSVNEIPPELGNVTLGADDIDYDETETVAEAISELKSKTVLSENEKVLTWSGKPGGGDDERLKSHLGLDFNNGMLRLLGKKDKNGDPIVLAEENIAMGAALVYAEVHVKSGVGKEGWTPALPLWAKPANKDLPYPDGTYLVLGFAESATAPESTWKPAIADLTNIIKIYSAGDGINITSSDDVNTKIVEVIVNPASIDGLKVTEDGVLLETKYFENEAALDEYLDNEKVIEGSIYYVDDLGAEEEDDDGDDK